MGSALEWFLLITICNIFAESICFHRHLSFCSQGEVCITACTGANTPPPGKTPLVQTPPCRYPTGQTPPSPRQTPYPGRHSPWADTPQQTPPGRHPPPPPDGHCNGRYASYWNAFLLINMTFHLKDFNYQRVLLCILGY